MSLFWREHRGRNAIWCSRYCWCSTIYRLKTADLRSSESESRTARLKTSSESFAHIADADWTRDLSVTPLRRADGLHLHHWMCGKFPETVKSENVAKQNMTKMLKNIKKNSLRLCHANIEAPTSWKLECATYSVLPSQLVPKLKEVRIQAVYFPFFRLTCPCNKSLFLQRRPASDVLTVYLVWKREKATLNLTTQTEMDFQECSKWICKNQILCSSLPFRLFKYDWISIGFTQFCTNSYDYNIKKMI